VLQKQLAALRRLELTNVGRLIRHMPMRYEQVEAEGSIADLAPGVIGSARGEIISTKPLRMGRRSRFEAILADDSGQLHVVWFNQLYLARKLHPGMRLRVEGQVRKLGAGAQMTNPRYEVLPGDADVPAERSARVQPVYPATESLPSRVIEQLIARTLPIALPLVRDHLDDEYRKARDLPALADALNMVHQPKGMEETRYARRRLAYDELLLLELGVYMKRTHNRTALRAPALRWSEAIDSHIRERLPFTFTPGQDRVARELAQDLALETPANRLIQGDVGSGKTAVALYAMLQAVASEKQAAMMAPTELLAEQHYASLSAMLAGSRVRLALLTGARTGDERAAILLRVESGDVDIVVGTHALLTKEVRFHSLAVALIDEQHRFGVHQRATFRAKAGDRASMPHVLVMTATPIPRTLSLTIFGDLDVSTIDDMPPGRKPVKTLLHDPANKRALYKQLRPRLEAGEQAFIVAPTIDGSESKAAAGVRDIVRSLEAGPFAGLRIAAMHGRLKRDTRERVMERFRAGRIDALVATTIIEVGVDVPGATIIVIEDADRFGLAQLHQLRGRVGRGAKPGECHLVASPTTPDGRARLAALVKLRDGFALAEKDLQIRGPGELFGTRQSGIPPFRVADLAHDTDLLLLARRDAAQWIARSPLLDKKGEELVRRRLLRTHGQWLGVADVA